MSDPFVDFFRVATATVENPNGVAPYDYQCRLADVGAATSRRVAIPTGLGKTAAIVLAWLWNRVAHPDFARRESWPRRLVYCLPMRTLVEQTRGEIHKWLENLLAAAGKLPLDPIAREQLQWLAAHSPVILMGGEENDADRREWDIHPERPAILIGTQDMLLSRARWPMHFGLLNNDALWVLDETQLMGVAVRTSAQLEGLRDAARLGTAAPCATWWASATLDERLLNTPDHPSLPPPLEFAQVEANWLIGRQIVEQEQHGSARAEYGKQIIALASRELTKEFGRGFSERSLRQFR